MQATDFRSPAELERTENLPKNRPRKALDCQTPAEVFKRGLTGPSDLFDLPGSVGSLERAAWRERPAQS